jgi:hypothetical protein
MNQPVLTGLLNLALTTMLKQWIKHAQARYRFIARVEPSVQSAGLETLRGSRLK